MTRRARLLLLILLCLSLAAAGLFLWERGPGLDREADRLMEVSGLRAGMTAADIGAGKGRMAVRVARRVGPLGRLYATEIEAGKQQTIRRAAATAGLSNITVLQAGERSTNLPSACCDAVYLRRVYHHLSDTAPMNRAIAAALKPDGRLVIIDFRFLGHGIEAGRVVKEVTSAGFELERHVRHWSLVDYCLVFRSRNISRAQLNPGAPMTPPPG